MPILSCPSAYYLYCTESLHPPGCPAIAAMRQGYDKSDALYFHLGLRIAKIAVVAFLSLCAKD
jgi:hypothetical protein